MLKYSSSRFGTMTVWGKSTLTLLAVLMVSISVEAWSSPSGTYLQIATLKNPTRIKRMLDITEIWTQFNEHVTTILDRVVPQPVRNFFSPGSQKVDHEEKISTSANELVNATSDADHPIKEHGQLDFGRELVKRVGKTIKDIGNKLGLGSTKGLDVDKSYFGGVATNFANFKDYVRAIYPGTRWCGDGDIAQSRQDLGYFHKADMCCREHDSCSDTIAPGEKRERLENSGLFTRSNCECDKKFYDCLKTANTIVSSKIGFTYFTVLGPQCFRSDHPIIECKTTQWKRCVTYQLDSSQDQCLQWFDNPIY